MSDSSKCAIPYFLSPEVRSELKFDPNKIEVFIQEIPDIPRLSVISSREMFTGKFYLGALFPIPTISVLREELEKHRVNVPTALDFLTYYAVKYCRGLSDINEIYRPTAAEIAKLMFSESAYPQAVKAFCMSGLELDSCGIDPSTGDILDIAE